MKRKKGWNRAIKNTLKGLPIFWRNMLVILITGTMVGLVGIGAFGLYLGATILFFAISIPIAVYTYLEKKRIDDIETHLSDFLRDLAEYNESGLPMPQAVMQAAKNDYGALSPEVKKLAAEISWGVSFEMSLKRMAERINSTFVRRAVMIITTAEAQGGEVTAILRTLGEDIRKLKDIEKERKGKLSVYTATVYVIFLLLLMIMIMLTATLAPAIPKMQVAGQFFSGVTGGLTETDFRTLLFHVSLIEAFFAGLISGQMGEGSVMAGLKHSIVLVAITLLAFSFVPPQPPTYKIADSIVQIPPVEGVQGSVLTFKGKFERGFTVEDVASEVRRIAKERNLEQYKNFEASQVEFMALICNACDQGLVRITSTKLEVNKPVNLQYRVRYSKGKYIVEFSDAE